MRPRAHTRVDLQTQKGSPPRHMPDANFRVRRWRAARTEVPQMTEPAAEHGNSPDVTRIRAGNHTRAEGAVPEGPGRAIGCSEVSGRGFYD